MNLKNEADSVNIQLSKLGQLAGFIGEQRDAWQKELGPMKLETPTEHMIRDQDILIGHLVETVGLLAVSLRDTIAELDARTSE